MVTTRDIATLVLVCAFAATAQAGERDFSLLECGVQLGGSELGYKPPSAMRSRVVNLRHSFAFRHSHRADPRPTADSRGRGFAPAESRFDFTRRSARSRLPAVLAIARVGCSWR